MCAICAVAELLVINPHHQTAGTWLASEISLNLATDCNTNAKFSADVQMCECVGS